ncbi:MAG: TRAP transporter small permease subunit [Candidatus Methylomirabilia bacterium]
MRRLIRALEAISEAAGALAALVVLGLTLFITSAVFSRRVLGSPILAADEVSGYFLLAIVFLGLAYTMKSGGHIRSDIVLAHVPPRMRGGLETLATLLALAFALVLLAGNWRLIAQYYTRGTLSFRYLQIPLWIPGILLVAGAAVLVVQLVAQLLRRLTGPGPSS